MNCLDIVIGSVHNGRSRIADHYTRDQSTPLLDAWYYGSESLTAAYGVERDGRTLIIFRRSIEASEKTDHSLGPGEKFVVWAKGQELGHYFHSPKSALEASEVEDPLFYRRNALMYHGKRNRGVHPMEFVKSNSASVIIGVSLTHLIIFSCATLLNRP
uniref:DOMON domain-containing protein n=1 Tax=Plectus sambesii TaxID=2011161 RepID=A0A914VU97_9BILA